MRLLPRKAPKVAGEESGCSYLRVDDIVFTRRTIAPGGTLPPSGFPLRDLRGVNREFRLVIAYHAAIPAEVREHNPQEALLFQEGQIVYDDGTGQSEDPGELAGRLRRREGRHENPLCRLVEVDHVHGASKTSQSEGKGLSSPISNLIIIEGTRSMRRRLVPGTPWNRGVFIRRAGLAVHEEPERGHDRDDYDNRGAHVHPHPVLLFI